MSNLKSFELLFRTRDYVHLLDREIYSEKFKLVLGEINNNLKDIGEVLEGNYFYHHQSQELTPYPAPTRFAKRIFLAKRIQHKSYVLEVGINAGHSALLILAANSKVKYLGVDIAQHGYTRSSSEILRKHFGESRNDFWGFQRCSTNTKGKQSKARSNPYRWQPFVFPISC